MLGKEYTSFRQHLTDIRRSFAPRRQGAELLPQLTPDTLLLERIVTPLEANPEAPVKLSSLTNLKDTAILMQTAFSGAGHIRFTKWLTRAIDTENDNRIHVMDMSEHSFSAPTHSAVSNNRFAKGFLEFAQRHMTIQQALAWPVRSLQFSHDLIPTLTAIGSYLATIPQEEVLIWSTHYESAAIIGFWKSQLETVFKKKITLMLQMTDRIHKAQTPWYLLDIDALMVPDEYAAEIADRELTRWEKIISPRRLTRWYRRPLVEVFPYPVDPLETRLLTDDEYANRIAQLDLQDRATALRIIMPLGGSSPQTKFLGSLVSGLKYIMDKPFEVTPIYNIKKTPSAFHERMQTRKYVKHIATNNTADQVEALHNAIMENTYALCITKPSEMHAYVQTHPRQRAGFITLLSAPVGEQEKDNLKSLRALNLLPDLRQQELLERVLLDPKLTINQMRTQLAPLLDQASLWRGLVLPYKKKMDEEIQGLRAALFINNAFEVGLIHKMVAEFARPNDSRAPLVWDGALRSWNKVNMLYPALQFRPEGTIFHSAN